MNNTKLTKIYIEDDCNTLQCVGYYPDCETKIRYGVKKDVDEFIHLCNWIKANFLTDRVHFSKPVIDWLISEEKNDTRVTDFFEKAGLLNGK